MTNQGNMTASKITIIGIPVTEHKDMKMYDLPNKGLKITVLRKLNELQKTQKYNTMKSEKQYMIKMRN